MKREDVSFEERKQAAIEKGLRVDSKGVPEADPFAEPNFAPQDVVKFQTEQGELTGVMLGFDAEGFAIVTVDGNDWRVAADKLINGTVGL